MRVVPGTAENIKVTTPIDLRVAELLLAGRAAMSVRTGIGYDCHRFAAGRRLRPGRRSRSRTTRAWRATPTPTCSRTR